MPLALTLAVILWASTAASSADRCGLVSTADIGAALGTRVDHGNPIPLRRDAETGASITGCGYEIREDVLVLDVAEFATPAAALRALAIAVEDDEEDPESPQMRVQTGLGDRAYWGSAEGSAIWLVVSGRNLLNVSYVLDRGNGARLREPLRRIATTVIQRL